MAGPTFMGIKTIQVQEVNPAVWTTNAAGKRVCSVNAELKIIRSDGFNTTLELDSGGIWFRDGDWVVLFHV